MTLSQDSQIVGDRDISVIQKCHELLFWVQRIPHGILQLATLFQMHRFQPRKILLKKGPNHILMVFFPFFGIWVSIFLVQGEQLCAILEPNRCLTGFYRRTIRHSFPPFPPGMSPSAAAGYILHLVITSIASVIRHPAKPLRKLSIRLPLRSGWYPDMLPAVLSTGVHPHLGFRGGWLVFLFQHAYYSFIRVDLRLSQELLLYMLVQRFYQFWVHWITRLAKVALFSSTPCLA